MKRVLMLLSIVFCVAMSLNAQTTEQKWDSANTMYINGDYRGAINLYDSILATGSASHKLYYNLGNAYFKDGNIGHAILNFNKALRISPSDKDTQHNLEVAGSYVKDKIESVPEFFLKTSVRGLRDSFSSNTWATASLVLLFIALGLVVLYLLTQSFTLRKVGFFGAIGVLLLAIFAMSSATIKKREIINPTEAIIMNNAVPVKSAPSKASTDIFVLHEGTKVQVVGRLQDWCEITIKDGNKGWILSSSIELI